MTLGRAGSLFTALKLMTHRFQTRSRPRKSPMQLLYPGIRGHTWLSANWRPWVSSTRRRIRADWSEWLINGHLAEKSHHQSCILQKSTMQLSTRQISLGAKTRLSFRLKPEDRECPRSRNLGFCIVYIPRSTDDASHIGLRFETSFIAPQYQHNVTNSPEPWLSGNALVSISKKLLCN